MNKYLLSFALSCLVWSAYKIANNDKHVNATNGLKSPVMNRDSVLSGYELNDFLTLNYTYHGKGRKPKNDC